jgi:hypothetical protein
LGDDGIVALLVVRITEFGLTSKLGNDPVQLFKLGIVVSFESTRGRAADEWSALRATDER